MSRLAMITALTAVAACLSAPPGSSPDAGSGQDGSSADDALIGNVLFFTFDDYRPALVYRDRSGNGFHAYAGNSDQVAGIYGSAMRSFRRATVDDFPGLFELPMTIEMWVRSRVVAPTGHLFGGDGSSIETLVHLEQGQVALTVNTGVETERETVVCDRLTVPAAEWIHIAVSWDGQVARFYGDAELACELDLVDRRDELVGSVFYIGGATDTDIDIDELKVSSFLKSEDQLVGSRAYDSSEMPDRCGDGFVVAGLSECEIDAPCCSSSCERLSDQECSDEAGKVGQCTADGLCDPGATGRVADAMTLYYFDDSSGGIVADMAGQSPTADLRIVDVDATTQMPGFLRLSSATALVVDQSAHLVNQILIRREVTVEAWVTPMEAPTESMQLPRRIVTLSPSLDETNITLGQSGTAYVTRIRHQGGVLFGEPVSSTGIGTAVPNALDHVVTTFSGTTVRTYLNGHLVEDSPRIAGLGNWTELARLQVGNEVTTEDALLGREWLGDLHLVALYDRALSPVEVAQNYLAGPDPEIVSTSAANE